MSCATQLVEACPGIRVVDIRRLDVGYTSRQWVADTDEGLLLVYFLRWTSKWAPQYVCELEEWLDLPA